jgi:hypothetical protein
VLAGNRERTKSVCVISKSGDFIYESNKKRRMERTASEKKVVLWQRLMENGEQVPPELPERMSATADPMKGRLIYLFSELFEHL